jgi:hypothetical protein
MIFACGVRFIRFGQRLRVAIGAGSLLDGFGGLSASRHSNSTFMVLRDSSSAVDWGRHRLRDLNGAGTQVFVAWAS